MKRFTVNGKSYVARAFDFNLMCDFEDMGVSIADVQSKPMATIRAYTSLCMGKGKEYAGKEIEQHLINGGTFEDVINAMNEEMEKSDFFRSLQQTTETEVTESAKKKTTK